MLIWYFLDPSYLGKTLKAAWGIARELATTTKGWPLFQVGKSTRVVEPCLDQLYQVKDILGKNQIWLIIEQLSKGLEETKYGKYFTYSSYEELITLEIYVV